MNANEVRKAISGGESLKVEFKRDRPQRLPDRDLFEAVVCLANAEGGLLLLGVEDDGAMTGLHPDRGASPDAFGIQAAIFNNTDPRINTRVSMHLLGGVLVSAIQVDPYPAICMTKAGTCVRRVMGSHGPECVPFYSSEHLSRRISLGLEDLSARTLSGMSWADLDPGEIVRLRRVVEERRRDRVLLGMADDELAQALGLVVSDVSGELVPVLAGLLLVGRPEALARLVPTHRTAYQVLRPDGRIGVNEALTGPILQQIEELETQYRARSIEDEIMVGMVRHPVPEVDPEAFREACVNALLHRDYSILGTIYIQWHPDRLCVVSPGGFPAGIHPGNILSHEPMPRNPRLAQVCQRIGLVEAFARGVDRIYEGQVRAGRPLPDYTSSDATAVRLELATGRANLDFVRFLVAEEMRGPRLSLDAAIALSRLHLSRRLTVDEFATLIQRAPERARATLDQLVERGLVEEFGLRPLRYTLSEIAFRELGRSTEFVRMSGLPPSRQEALIVEFARARGRVTTAEVAELCGIASATAKLRLKRLIDRGLLEMVGERRAAHYVPRGSDFVPP